MAKNGSTSFRVRGSLFPLMHEFAFWTLDPEEKGKKKEETPAWGTLLHKSINCQNGASFKSCHGNVKRGMHKVRKHRTFIMLRVRFL